MEQFSLFDKKLQEMIQDGIQFLQHDVQDTKEITPTEEVWTTSNSTLSCSYCRTEFADVSEQRQHCKLDWHRYNLKQSLLSKLPITEEEFDNLAELSSISGSESDEKDENVDNVITLQGKMFLKNGDGKVFSMYRCLLFEKKEELTNDALMKSLNNCLINTQWTLFMLGGGHFAGAIFKSNTPILHKTFHCYTVRAGQGGSQSSRDNRSACSQPKSAGASLRRYNEAAFVQHVTSIVDNWKDEIAKSNFIIFRAPGPFNRAVLFGGKTPVLNKSDSRLRSIPFATRRATFTEVKRVHSLLTTIEFYDNLEMIQLPKGESSESLSKRKIRPTNKNRSKSREIQQRLLDTVHSTSSSDECVQTQLSIIEQEISFSGLISFEDSLSPEQRLIGQHKKKRLSKTKRLELKDAARKKEICDIIRMGDITKLETIVKDLDIPQTEISETKQGLRSINEVLDDNGNGPLHVAAIYEESQIIKLLLKHNADLCSRNNKQQTPYTCVQNPEVRNIFKNFAKEYPNKYNYNKAQIPVNMLSLEEQEEKKKVQRKLKREKEKEKKQQIYHKKQEDIEKERFLNLSDREKRALAAERRILSQTSTVLTRCFLCAIDISGKVPFEYSNNRFCSIECLKAHRLQSTILTK